MFGGSGCTVVFIFSNVIVGMGYTVELSFDMRKKSKVFSLLTCAEEIAHACSASFHYDCSDTEERNYFIIVTEFDDLEDVKRYIHEVKCTKSFHIECVYSDTPTCSLIYASLRYLKQLDRTSASEYRCKKKQNRFNESESQILSKIIK